MRLGQVKRFARSANTPPFRGEAAKGWGTRFGGGSLFEAGAWGYVFAEGGEDGFAVFSVAGGEEHAVGL